jgi:hypothetical protein
MQKLEKTDPFRNWAKAINSILQTSRELSNSVADHGGMIGESREFFVREILNRFLPKSVEVGTGQIVDCDNELSKQIDIVISRPEFPILTTLATSDVFFADSVIATIEVKSKLVGGDGGSLWEALDNSRSVKQLELTDPSLYGDDISAFWRLVRRSPKTYIFGYKGYKGSLSSLREALVGWIETRKPLLEELPNVIVTEGCVVVSNFGVGEVFDTNAVRRALDYHCVFIAREDVEALTWLLVHLLGYVGDIHTRSGYGYARYAWGLEFAAKAFREKSWQTWGKWEYDNELKEAKYDLDKNHDGQYPRRE